MENSSRNSDSWLDLNQLVNHFCIASEKECWFKKRKTLFTKMIIVVIFVFV